ncbi:cytochrome b/b6 domain-containing protein [Paraburkholderia sp. D15]|uniref:cytochrome b/b6 domain-containing protein n=1 Tax=Paraburkholderia sp. D15 TaxID=2880218 RepID=UPI0024797DA0|nr:cytochrome b/b6 domain-containing protein [Paraburkholderia sp. D15]WGS52692.1 cytochrome b/b6 domain-containing protein [Paraburkholderia sp. D15]
MDPRPSSDAPPQSVERPVLVWDWPTRLFHWSVVLLVLGAYITIKLNWMDWHVRIGETLLALVLFRLFWGCAGSETARFRHFLKSPAAALHHLRDLFRREPDVQVGHNPAGGWMVVLLLALLLTETLSGLYVYNDVADVGPLSAWMPAVIANAIETLHGVGWDALVVAVILHLSAIVLYALAKGHNLLRPMLTGRKPLPMQLQPPRVGSSIRALCLLVIASAIVVALATYL